MPNSLKCKIKHLCHNGTITERERDRILKALEQEPKFIVKSDGTIEQIKNCDDCVFKKEWEKIGKLLSVVLEKLTEQEPILDKIRAEINSPNRGTCDYFIVDRIEEIIDRYMEESEEV